jgi:signal transduction histidine kinase
MIDTPQSLTEKLYQKNLELLYERKRMEQLLYSVSEAVIAVNLDYHITLFNHTAEVLINKNAVDVLNTDINKVIELFNTDGSPFNIKDYCFKNGNIEQNNLVLNTETHKQHFIIFKSVVVANDTSPEECLITLTDITHEKELEQAKDDFISVASHELRTPMTIIKSYLWMLTAGKGGNLNTKQLEYLYKATHATQRMIDLINDTLSVSRLEQGRVEYSISKIDITEVIKEYLTDLYVKAQERNIFIQLTTSSPCFVYADASKVGEVVTNLVGNAIKFTRNGGITINIVDELDFINISITDTGAGISPQDQKSLFLKFGRLDNSYQTVAETGGTGLGLYIVKLYIEGMGGKVGAISEGINKGSTFWFTLPKNKLSITSLSTN